ncbi:MAG: hypothetical protein KTR32_33885 [Granulosicoccus sp.]|nr:hypothetical protein [Granulosicoccus sp.]
MSVHLTIKQLDQLIRVQSLRVKHAEREYKQQKSVVDEELQYVEKLCQQINQIDADRQNLLDFLRLQDSNVDPVTLSDANIRRNWLAYDREQAVYYLDIAKENLAEAEADLAARKNRWLKAQKRQSQSQDQYRVAKRQTNGQREINESLAVQEQFSGKVSRGINVF